MISFVFGLCESTQAVKNPAAGEFSPPSKILTGPASPRRSVCAPGDDRSLIPQTASEEEYDHASHILVFPKATGAPPGNGDIRGSSGIGNVLNPADFAAGAWADLVLDPAGLIYS